MKTLFYFFAFLLAGTFAASPVAKAGTIPSGTVLVIRTLDTVSSHDKPGKKFAGKLDSSLVVKGVTVAKAGSKVYGRVNDSQAAGRAFGQSRLSLSLTDISINGKMVAIATSASESSGARSGRKTVAGAGTGALIGAAFDGGSGAGKGAAIGAGVSMLKPGQAVVVPAGTLLDFRLAVSASY